MSRIDEVKDITNTMTMVIEKINESGIELESYRAINLILANIGQQLTEISISLAIIADKLGDN